MGPIPALRHEVGSPRDVRRSIGGSPTCPLDLPGDLGEFFLVASAEHEASAPTGQMEGGGAPDAASGTGDGDDLVLDGHGGFSDEGHPGSYELDVG
jgi:hypothetical protein